MTNYRRNTWLALVAVIVALVAFPVSYSAAQSANVSLSALECEQLGHIREEQMNIKQRKFARECDIVEASHDWEQQYGGFNEREFVAGVVYE